MHQLFEESPEKGELSKRIEDTCRSNRVIRASSIEEIEATLVEEEEIAHGFELRRRIISLKKINDGIQT